MIGAIDQGTSNTRFIVFDDEGNVVSSHYKEHEQICARAGWVEHNPVEILENTRSLMKLTDLKIEAIGITNQRETVVVWDKETGSPLYNAIVWQCTRTREICRDLINEGMDEIIEKKTGLLINTYFSAPKIRWLMENVERVKEAVKTGRALFGTVDSYLIWNLTHEHITDCTNASRTLLMNIDKLRWDEDLLDIFGIDESLLPEIRSSSEIYGYTEEGIPVSSAIGDQQAALFGQTCFEDGDAKNTYGTGNFLLVNTGEKRIESKHGILTTVAYKLKGGSVKYALEGSIAVTGSAVQWLRDNLNMINDSSETEAMASAVQDNGGVYFVPAFSGLFAPYWDMDARGIITGLTRYTNKNHIVRAVLESICYQTRDVVEAIKNEIGIKELKVDGGATVNDLLMQLQADIMGVKIIRPKIKDTTALGAAYCAGLAIDKWNSMDELREMWMVEREFEPGITEEERNKLYKQWKLAVERCRS